MSKKQELIVSYFRKNIYIADKFIIIFDHISISCLFWQARKNENLPRGVFDYLNKPMSKKKALFIKIQKYEQEY